MPDIRGYTTLARRGEAERVILRSRFLAVAAPAAAEEAALAVLGAERARHRDAGHHCYAYIIGANAGVMRYSDDGEPGGTAGVPILETLRARGIVNAVAVVTRYFGGVKLGAGGLARAYASACAAAVAEAGTAEMIPTATVGVDLDYAQLGRVERCLEALPVRGIQKEYAERVTLLYRVRVADQARVAVALADACDGRAAPIRLEEGVMGWTDETARCAE